MMIFGGVRWCHIRKARWGWGGGQEGQMTGGGGSRGGWQGATLGSGDQEGQMAEEGGVGRGRGG